MKPKLIAMYLPQFHRIPENDLWWGEGYTDWSAVKKAQPLFKGHQQPRVPYGENYYDLSDRETIAWQAELAEKYGIYGFGIYHYWFSSKQVLLDKPAYIIKDNPELNMRYFFMWDNGNWKRSWSNVRYSNSWAPAFDKEKKGPEVLAELKYGDEEEWKKHFNYLLPFFRDGRYIKINGKPLFGVFCQTNNPDLLKRMFQYWNECAVDAGLPGIEVLGKSNASHIKVADCEFDYEPATHAWSGRNVIQDILIRSRERIKLKLGILKKYSYGNVWRNIINDVDDIPNHFPGAFVRYDDTPRRGRKSAVVLGESPELFKNEMTELLRRSKQLKKEFIFLTAWNEWGEGAYLEPDEADGFAYLVALKEAIRDACI